MTQPRSALLIDFGSTYTKLRAIDLGRRCVIGSGQGPSTVSTDVTVGMQAALADLEHRIGRLPHFQYRLASSSAAGGLRMVTVGLVPELTAEAARQAALGAGAKLVGTFAYELTQADVDAIRQLAPDILLLVGGTDGGNRDVILNNARVLGAGSLRCPVIVAGNRTASAKVSDLLQGMEVVVTENVMPELNVLNVDPARAAIRQVFIDRIVHAKGIDRAQDFFDQVLMPTPAAVMDAATLLADGCGGERQGLGPLLVVDPGGATTDVHSVCKGAASGDGVLQVGLPEARVKRTVEGDLGMRHTAAAIVDAAGLSEIAADAGLDEDSVQKLVAGLGDDPERLPANPADQALDRALGRAAVRLAVLRHAGTLETVYTANGPVSVQRGKDLGDVQAVIGTGGVLVHGADPGAILEMALATANNPLSLRPRQPRLLLDSDYLLYGCGLLASVEPEAAYDLALQRLQPLPEETGNGR